jgi:Zn-dependent protease with chaperone function
MHSIVFLPFVLSVVVVVLSRLGVNRLQPRAAAWGITVTAVALSVSTAGALVLLACPLPARLPFVAALGRWQPDSIASRTPVPVWLSTVGLLALAWLGWRLVRELRRLGCDFSDVVAAHADLAQCGVGEVVVVEADVPRAHAVSRTLTRRGRVVVTTAMLELLDDEERAAVVAHERSHLRHGHGAFRAVMQLAIASNPLLAWMRRDLQFALERWADEDAASVTHRTVIASALAKAAIAVLHITEHGVAPAMHLHTHAVPERVTALLDEPPSRTRLAWAFLGLGTIAALSLAWAMHDTERFFEAVRLWHHS